MERIAEKYKVLCNALITLHESIELWHGSTGKGILIERALRDSVIQRFEYNIDIFWKYIKLYMQDYQKITLDIASPRGILQAARTHNIISVDEFVKLMNAVSDRNLTCHTYNEELAIEIANRVPEHYTLIHNLTHRLPV
jgi:nucleotidyltransferase substrate binding protein (TIGR01987 family)